MSMKDRIVNYIIERPKTALLVGFVVFMACASGGRTLAPDFSYRVWFNDDDPLIMEFDAFERRFGNDDRAIVVVHSPSGIFDKDSAELLTKFTEEAWKLPYTIRVDSLANFNWVHADGDELIVEPLIPDDLPLTPELLTKRAEVARTHETLPNYLVSPDATAALLYITLQPALGGSPDYEGFLEGITTKDGEKRRGLRDLVKEMTRGDHEIMVTGGPEINHSFKEAAEADISSILPLVFGLTLLFLGILFRRVSGVLLPIAVMVTTVGAAMGVGGWMGFSINNMTSIVPQILVAIAVADSVHILVSYYRALKKGATRTIAAHYSLEKNFVPTVLTSVSTAIGFFSFFPKPPSYRLNNSEQWRALVLLLARIFTYYVIGPLMVLLPIKAAAEMDENIDLHAPSPLAIRQTEKLLGARRVILAFFAIIAVGTTYLAAQTEVNSDPFMYFPDDSNMNVATRFLEKKVGGATTVEIVVDSGEIDGVKNPTFLKKVEEFQSWLDEQPYVTSSNSLIDILKSTIER